MRDNSITDKKFAIAINDAYCLFIEPAAELYHSFGLYL
jgi:hypothetical protein